MDAFQRSTEVCAGPPQVPSKFESLPRELTRTADVSPSAVTAVVRKLLISFVDGQNRTQEADGRSRHLHEGNSSMRPPISRRLMGGAQVRSFCGVVGSSCADGPRHCRVVARRADSVLLLQRGWARRDLRWVHRQRAPVPAWLYVRLERRRSGRSPRHLSEERLDRPRGRPSIGRSRRPDGMLTISTLA
jgi:hypothetical protein